MEGLVKYVLGWAYSHLSRNLEAVAAYENAIALVPENATAHHELGLTYLRLNRPEEAKAQFATCVELRPDEPDAHLQTWLCSL
jgi:Tfp pilus assembly protein PilF